MKTKRMTYAAAIALSGSILFSSCVGSFSLFNKVSAWNQSVSNKFVNELVFIALNIIPVYGVAYAVDAIVLNSIEFWTGSNPVANAGEVQKIKGENGNYFVENTENGYTITKEGEKGKLNLVYDEASNTWNSIAENGEIHKLVKMNNDGTADLYLPTGNTMNVSLDAHGILAARNATTSNLLFAAR